MLSATIMAHGSEHMFVGFGRTTASRLILLRIAIALPSLLAAAIGVIFLFACADSKGIRRAGAGVVLGAIASLLVASLREAGRLDVSGAGMPTDRSALSRLDPGAMVGAAGLFLSTGFALRVAISGNAAFSRKRPKRIRGRRAIHGEADWMPLADAQRLFPNTGGIVIGEQYRVDRSGVADQAFRGDDKASWGPGGRSPLLCFDCSFGSTHGIVFAGSGGFKTTSVTIPTALKWGGTLVLLDPSNEVAPMVGMHRRAAGRRIKILDPHQSQIGFNALDWIGKFGASKEEDIAAIASWIMSDSGRIGGLRDDFFRASGQQLLTAMIADVCLSGQTDRERQTLRQVRANLSEPEPKLRRRLEDIYETSESEFVRGNVAVFVNMTPETFSGVYANAVKETHWLSYPNYAALVSGSSFSTDDLASGEIDVFINIDLKTLDTHAGLARLIIGSFLNAIYNRDGTMNGHALFLLDEAARLGYMRILETARDAGRKYGITLTMIYQSIGQMRETYGGRDAASKWFESASWISFSAINDPETADYISRRCGVTTVEIDQESRSLQSSGSSRTRSKQLASRPLIQPHEVLQMRADEQIVFTAGNPPLRCGRAIWFRRRDMRSCVNQNRFHAEAPRPG
jgi:type IV secretion system protein VirD4